MLLSFFITLHVGCCLAFTKDIRSFGVDLDPTNDTPVRVYFDRAVTPLKKACDAICEKLGCVEPSNGTSLASAVRSLMDIEASATLSSILTDYYSREPAAASKWLDLADDITRRQAHDSQFEVEALRNGRVSPRRYCFSNDTTMLKNKKGCLLAEVFSEVDLFLTGRLKPLDYWLTAAEKLFNGQYYDHAEALIYFLLKEITASKLDLRGDYYYTRALLMLTEVTKEKGRLKESVYFALLVIDSDANSPVTSALHRLRLVLTVPPIPPPGSVAVPERQQMVTDLYSLLDDIIEDSLSLTMKELSTGVNSTPFHVAHQGLNDRFIQIVLSKIYSYLCPELLYVSPHLYFSRHLSEGDDSESGETGEEGGSNSLISLTTDSSLEVARKSASSNSSTSSRSLLVNNHDCTTGSAAAVEASILLPTAPRKTPVLLPACPVELAAASAKPIRVGFVSTNFYDHSIGRMLVELLVIMHEKGRHRDRPVEVFVFFVDSSLGRGDEEETEHLSGGESYSVVPPITEDFVVNTLSSRLGTQFRRLPASLPLLQTEIAREELDFLMFTDLGMDFITYALAHSRLATNQAAWWGHPITSGAATMDYYFGLDIEVPFAGEEHYSEQLVRMDVMNSAPIRPLPLRTIEENAAMYRSIAAPADPKICMVLGRLFKLHPDFDEALAGILVGTPDNIVLVFVAEKLGEWNKIIYDRLLNKVTALVLQETQSGRQSQSQTPSIDGSYLENAFESESLRHGDSEGDRGGVASARAVGYMGKVRFVSYERYSDFLLLAEAVLDTYPYGGCLTAHDALSNGIPMVTLPLEHVRGRYALGMYRQMGINSLIAYSPAEYIAIAVKLLTDEVFRMEQYEKIVHHYAHDFHKNSLVADEWLGFIQKITVSNC